MKKWTIMTALLFLAVAGALAEDQVAYTNDSVARLNHITGNAYLQRASDLGYEEGQVNMPVSEGDRLGTTDGRLEVALGRRNYVRLDTDTKVDFLNFPSKNAAVTKIKVWAGNIYVSLNSLLREKALEVHSADASVYFLEKGLVRVDVLEGDRTEILVFEGTVEVAGGEGSNILSAGQKIEAAGGRFLSRPSRFLASADDRFDEWNNERDALLGKEMAGRYLPQELWEYESELDAYGDWRLMSPYGNVWIPRGMGPGWRPYYYGRWTWIPFCGWTWISFDSWGWAPFHYGRWHWDPFYGWYWIPTNIWGPAWVSWWWGWDYYGWTPLSWYGYPGVILHNNYYDRYHGDYPRDSRAMTVVHKNQLKAPDVSKVSVLAERLKNAEKVVMSTDLHKAPRPETVRGVAVEKLDGGRVFLRSRDQQGSEERVIRDRSSRSGTDTERGTVIRSRDASGARTTEPSGRSTRENSSDRSSGRVIERPSRTEPVKKDSEPATSSDTSERKIRKKDDDSPAGSSAYMRSGASGYPSSTESGRSGTSGRSSTYKSRPSPGGFYEHILGSGSSSSGSSSRYGVSSQGGTSRSSSVSRSSSGYRSSGSSSRSSSGHSSSRSSSSSSSARRKN